MAYTKEQMVYKNDYKWTVEADKDNPEYRHGKDHDELNRFEGYEMRDFINSLADGWKWKNAPIVSYQNLEKIIKNRVPHDIHKHEVIKKWIEDNFKGIKEQKF